MKPGNTSITSITGNCHIGNTASDAPSPSEPIRLLPLITLYLSERCNSRCVTCDYWRHGSADMTLAFVLRLLPDLAALQTETVLISGGEPLLNSDWADIAQLLRSRGMNLWLLTSGLSLAKHATKVAALFHRVTVSLDGTDRETYKAIRGLDAFDTVCDGIRKATGAGIGVGLRVTVQRDNFRSLRKFVQLAHELRVQEISFLAADVANRHAFGRDEKFSANVALGADDLPVLERTIRAMANECADDFESGFIAENPGKLRRIWQYYSAVCGHGTYPSVHCNAPEFSAVVEAQGRIRPCFFIPGPQDSDATPGVKAMLNSSNMTRLRTDIRAGHRTECSTCVCSAWRDQEPHA